MFKKIIACVVAVATLLTITGCANTAKEPNKKEFTGTELSKAITDARDAEMNEAMQVVTSDDAEQNQMMLDFIGIDPENAPEYAFSVSLMNVKAYGVAVVMPKAGDEKAVEAVKTALTGFVTSQQKNFEMYLQDQYEIAKNAKVEVLENGVVIMVMCEDSDKVYEAIVKNLTA